MMVRPRLRAALPSALAAVAGLMVLGIPIVLGIESSERAEPWWLLLFNNAQTLLVFTPAVAPFIKVFTTRYIIEEGGIREEVRFLSSTQRRVTWEKVTALRQRRGPFERLLGIERLDVIAYGERGATIHLIGLRDAASLRNRFAKEMRDASSVDSLFRAD